MNRKWLLTIVVALILYAGVATAAVFAVALSVHTSECTNGTLGARGGITNQSAIAQRNFAAADSAYNAAVVGLVTHPARNAAGRARATTALLKAATTKKKASNNYYNAMNAILRTANAHPLGRC